MSKSSDKKMVSTTVNKFIPWLPSFFCRFQLVFHFLIACKHRFPLLLQIYWIEFQIVHQSTSAISLKRCACFRPQVKWSVANVLQMLVFFFTHPLLSFDLGFLISTVIKWCLPVNVEMKIR